MREIKEIRKRLLGDEALAASYLGQARTLLGLMKNIMRLGGLQQLARHIVLPDGTSIRVSSVFGLDTVEIDVRPVKREEEPPVWLVFATSKVLGDASHVDRYYLYRIGDEKAHLRVEVDSRDYPAWAEPSNYPFRYSALGGYLRVVPATFVPYCNAAYPQAEGIFRIADGSFVSAVPYVDLVDLMGAGDPHLADPNDEAAFFQRLPQVTGGQEFFFWAVNYRVDRYPVHPNLSDDPAKPCYSTGILAVRRANLKLGQYSPVLKREEPAEQLQYTQLHDAIGIRTRSENYWHEVNPASMPSAVNGDKGFVYACQHYYDADLFSIWWQPYAERVSHKLIQIDARNPPCERPNAILWDPRTEQFGFVTRWVAASGGPYSGILHFYTLVDGQPQKMFSFNPETYTGRAAQANNALKCEYFWRVDPALYGVMVNGQPTLEQYPSLLGTYDSTHGFTVVYEAPAGHYFSESDILGEWVLLNVIPYDTGASRTLIVNVRTRQIIDAADIAFVDREGAPVVITSRVYGRFAQ